MARFSAAFAVALLSVAAVAGVVATGDMLPCRFMVPFTIWTHESGCPTPAATYPCQSDIDCQRIPKQCTYGPGTPSMKCLDSLGSKVCAHRADALPDLTRAGGVCNTTAGEVCSLTLSTSYPDIPQCVPSSYCHGRSTVKCYPNGHDIDHYN
eukprot:CAMPEP_0174854212 /NCGR_PEP_ID=MMETSP1114-20130205/30397_1 /TAXON_ID=312471 /ORGANISM="Neobodo designis, Strain CCAP 1951/1" /LENGTH=151 /DNA_ID=CAMNT_0016088895 /DNA_START=65 /DNA_END=520 /DNA_ORIENTATION=+